jgi:hypothetical protein
MSSETTIHTATPNPSSWFQGYRSALDGSSTIPADEVQRRGFAQGILATGREQVGDPANAHIVRWRVNNNLGTDWEGREPQTEVGYAPRPSFYHLGDALDWLQHRQEQPS